MVRYPQDTRGPQGSAGLQDRTGEDILAPQVELMTVDKYGLPAQDSGHIDIRFEL
jgi:hypothetical protein